MQALASSFFLQMAVILLACRVVGMLARKIGQPQVVGEMIAGVLIGPSLLGWLWPDSAKLIFTQESRGILYVGAQLGVGLYMFLVGLEFNTGHFRSRARSAACVSVAGMVVPFILGALLVLWLQHVPGIFSPKVRYFEGALFLGAAIAITAFPMLARIISERGLSGTPLGTLALAAGAIDDAAAWCVLAVVLATFGASQPVEIARNQDWSGGGGHRRSGDLWRACVDDRAEAAGRFRQQGGKRRGGFPIDDGGGARVVLHRGLVHGRHRRARGVRRFHPRHRDAARRVCGGYPEKDRTLRGGVPAADVLHVFRAQHEARRAGGRSEVDDGWAW